MLQIGVAVYCLALWAGIVFSAQLPQTPEAFLALILISAIALIALSPRVVTSRTPLHLTPHAPAKAPTAQPATPSKILGAPGTPGAAVARAPSRALALT